MNRIDAYLDWLQQLTPATLPAIDRHVAADVRFVDPFHDCRGVGAMRSVFERMFAMLSEVRWTVVSTASHGDQHFARWTFEARARGSGSPTAITFPGVSRIIGSEAGVVMLHEDFWDPSLLVAQTPVIGWAVRRLKRRVSG